MRGPRLAVRLSNAPSEGSDRVRAGPQGLRGQVDPELLLGDTLFPLVTLLVSLLLYHSGLQLRIADLPGRARVTIRNPSAVTGRA